MSSGTFSKLSHTALAAEWEKITGAFDTFRVCRAKASDAWDKSTIMPSRFISPTTFCRDSSIFCLFVFVGKGCQGHMCVHISIGNGWVRIGNRNPHLTKACQPADVGVEVVFILGGTLCPAGQPGEGTLVGHILTIKAWGLHSLSACPSIPPPKQGKDLDQLLSGSHLLWTPLFSALWHFPYYAIYHSPLARHYAHQGVLQVKVSVR